MLHRLFSTIIIALFFMAIHNQSHSAELTREPHIPEFLSEKKVVQYRKSHCSDQKIDMEAVREKSSRFIIDREYLKRSRIDVPDVNESSSQVVSRFSLSSSEHEEKKILDFVNDLAQSQIINLSLRGNLRPELAEVLVALLQGGVRFQITDIWGLQCQGFNPNNNFQYHRIKIIGSAAKTNGGELFIVPYYSVKHHLFNSDPYDSEKEYRQDLLNKVLKEKKCIRVGTIKKEQQTFDYVLEKILPHLGILVMSTLVVYSVPLALFTCVMLMIILAIPLG